MRVIVTGTSTGIGQALAARLLSRGHEVWGLARTAHTLPAGSASGASFRSLQCDVADWGQMEQAARTVSSACSHVDALVTCAAIQGEVGRTLAANPAQWAATIRVNLDGTFHAIRAFAPLLAQSPRRAKVVCFSGGGATSPRPNFSAYGAAKTAVVRLVETIAAEERSRALDINAVAPGAINTRLTDEVLQLGPEIAGAGEFQKAQEQKAKGGSSLGGALDLVEWLLSPESDGISGRLISAPWDPWRKLGTFRSELGEDIYTLRRVRPEDRGKSLTWDSSRRETPENSAPEK